MIAEVKDNKLVFKIEDSFQIFGQSFNRIRCFLPITENLDLSSLPDVWDIKGRQDLLHAFKGFSSEKDRKEILEGYKHFITRYLLRDCIESFALGLDHLYSILMIRNTQFVPGTSFYAGLTEREQKQIKDFERVGLYRRRDGKIQRLKKDLGLEISKDHHKVVAGLKGIRDCLSHSNGIVMPEYGSKTAEPNVMEFSWLAFSVHAVGVQTGKKFEVRAGIELPEASNIIMDLKSHSKTFKVGEHLTFSSYEVFEIAYSLNLVATQYVKGAANLIKSEKAA